MPPTIHIHPLSGGRIPLIYSPFVVASLVRHRKPDASRASQQHRRGADALMKFAERRCRETDEQVGDVFICVTCMRVDRLATIITSSKLYYRCVTNHSHVGKRLIVTCFLDQIHYVDPSTQLRSLSSYCAARVANSIAERYMVYH